MKKGLKVFLTAAIVLSAVACSTTSDEETKDKDGKVIYESRNTFPTRSKFMELEEKEGTDSLLYSILCDVIWKSKSTEEFENGFYSFLEVVKLVGVKSEEADEIVGKLWIMCKEEIKLIHGGI